VSATTWLANGALAAAYASDHRRLVGIRDLARVQERLLATIVRRNRGCEVGRAHGFADVSSVESFRSAVPLSTWDDYADAAARIAGGARGVLTTERVRLLEPSSGSTAATKLIPYTAGLRAEYQRGIRPWLHDLYTAYPALRCGRSYWSITPAAQVARPPSLVPIGFDEDADYLGPLAKRLVTSVFAVDSAAARAPTMDAFFDATCAQLLAADDLALVSVWNPTFFTLLLGWLTEHGERLARSLPQRRRDAAASCLRDGDWRGLWPRLAVVSCWADAAAAGPARDLMAALPGVTMQAKGLLATEGFVSLPLVAAGGAVLSARSHFFEFLPEGETEPVLAHELDVGARYAVVLTTSGGLYRYRLGDLVEVRGRHGVLPVVAFLGRCDKVSDLVGEKLNEAFVTGVFASLGLGGSVLAPAGDHYVLHTASTEPGLAERLDAALCANFHYDYARRLGQLGGVELRPPRPQDRPGAGVQPARLGAIKPTVLARDDPR